MMGGNYLKKCTKCCETKSLEEFSPDKRVKDGRCASCKECCNKKYREWYKNGGKDWMRKYEQSEKGKDAKRKANQKQREKNPNHIKARKAVAYALAAGRLERPNFCSECGCKCKAEAHHWSYEEEHWLDIQWLCRSCHLAIHQENSI